MKRLALSCPLRRWWRFQLPFESAEPSVSKYRDSEEMSEFGVMARFSIKEGMREDFGNESQAHTHIGCTYEKEVQVLVPVLVSILVL